MYQEPLVRGNGLKVPPALQNGSGPNNQRSGLVTNPLVVSSWHTSVVWVHESSLIVPSNGSVINPPVTGSSFAVAEPWMSMDRRHEVCWEPDELDPLPEAVIFQET